MNSLTLLIIGAPALLAVIAFKKAEKQRPKLAPPYRTGRDQEWAWPPKWRRPVAKTGKGSHVA